jgi:hypothetical protein
VVRPLDQVAPKNQHPRVAAKVTDGCAYGLLPHSPKPRLMGVFPESHDVPAFEFPVGGPQGDIASAMQVTHYNGPYWRPLGVFAF